MGDKHLSTISETESDEVIKSSVKNLVQIPSEYEVTSNNESECDVPVKDESSPIFTTFSNPIFDYNDDFTSSDDELLSKEDCKNYVNKNKQLKKNSDIHQLIREVCGIKVCEEQKQNTKDTMLQLLEVCRQKELYCMRNDVDDLIESSLNSKLLSINLKSQRLNKETQEGKNIVE
nr:hypothetical protein [Tanacetum cinerariifolium]